MIGSSEKTSVKHSAFMVIEQLFLDSLIARRLKSSEQVSITFHFFSFKMVRGTSGNLQLFLDFTVSDQTSF